MTFPCLPRALPFFFFSFFFRSDSRLTASCCWSISSNSSNHIIICFIVLNMKLSSLGEGVFIINIWFSGGGINRLIKVLFRLKCTSRDRIIVTRWDPNTAIKRTYMSIAWIYSRWKQSDKGNTRVGFFRNHLNGLDSSSLYPKLVNFPQKRSLHSCTDCCIICLLVSALQLGGSIL